MRVATWPCSPNPERLRLPGRPTIEIAVERLVRV